MGHGYVCPVFDQWPDLAGLAGEGRKSSPRLSTFSVGNLSSALSGVPDADATGSQPLIRCAVHRLEADRSGRPPTKPLPNEVSWTLTRPAANY